MDGDTLSVRPAMCAMQLTPLNSRRVEFDAWLQQGREVLASTLSARRPADGVPTARLILGNSFSDPEASKRVGGNSLEQRLVRQASSAAENQVLQRCFQWIHVPAADSEKPDLVTIIFTRESDLQAWRSSPERAEWLHQGESLARKEGHLPNVSKSGNGGGGENGDAEAQPSIIKDTQSIHFHRDDGSLGGWLPASAEQSEKDGSAAEAPPATWRVTATVLVAMYPMQEVNRLVLMPSLDALSPELWGGLPSSMQLFVACQFAAIGTTFLLLPPARRFTERIGFMGGGGAAGGQQAKALSALLLAYVGLLVVGMSASSIASEVGTPFERLGKVTPHRQNSSQRRGRDEVVR